jgi:thiamine pyrophosphate-dependent acetolactate synthase large subunit-like protein
VDAFLGHGLTFGNPDFLKYAQAYGLTATRVECADALMIPMLEAAFAAGGVHLVTVPIDYSENTRVLQRRVGESQAARNRPRPRRRRTGRAASAGRDRLRRARMPRR